MLLNELIVTFIIILAGFYFTILIADSLKSEKAEKLVYVVYGIFSLLVLTIWASEHIF